MFCARAKADFVFKAAQVFNDKVTRGSEILVFAEGVSAV